MRAHIPFSRRTQTLALVLVCGGLIAFNTFAPLGESLRPSELTGPFLRPWKTTTKDGVVLEDTIGWEDQAILGEGVHRKVSQHRVLTVTATETETVQVPTTTTKIVEPSASQRPLVNGPPTAKMRDNLRPELKYITSWHGAGITNDMMAHINLLYLAKQTDRIPIMDIFFADWGHVGFGYKVRPPPMLFGDVFDLPRFTNLTGVEVLQWPDVKAADSREIDSFGCWNLEQANLNNQNPHLGATTPGERGFDISYMVIPPWTKQYPEQKWNEFVRLSQLVALSFPEKHKENVQAQQQTLRGSTLLGLKTPPDEQLMCFDWLFNTCENAPHDVLKDYSSTWRQIGQHLHFHPKIEGLAHEYLRKAFQLSVDQPVPPYIAVHVRRGDFDIWCTVPREECFTPFLYFARKVKKMQEQLLADKGLTIQHVVVTSDESADEFWADVASYGYGRPDHTTTKEEYGAFYPVFIDNAIQGLAHGIVGTEMSTVSRIAAKRIESWQGGINTMVSFRKLEAEQERE
ncbi:hypothetical protein HMN09_01276300 [Mycena chlorophos]|uniref:Uncharacterized protein n=1 Tax=Mycena chlorophos TaxID=658473 RepID=A0A8H6S1H4_MYCCL|nr:hypothetical protein HMN09_01276300 [Mycena chlorophos]